MLRGESSSANRAWLDEVLRYARTYPLQALVTWLISALVIGSYLYFGYVKRAESLATHASVAVARLACYPGEDCHHSSPFLYRWVANDKTYIAVYGVRGKSSSSYSRVRAPDARLVYYDSSDPRNWSFTPPTAQQPSSALLEALIMTLGGATVATILIVLQLDFRRAK